MKPTEPRPRRAATAMAGAEGFVAGVAEFGQLALWMAAMLAGLVTTTIAARAPVFRRLVRKLGGDAPQQWRRAGDPRPSMEESLPLLVDAIIGNSKSAVAAVFGPPRSALVQGPVAIGGGACAFMQADTWYYPLPKNDGLAMAIEFDDDSARHVEFFTAPNVSLAA